MPDLADKIAAELDRNHLLDDGGVRDITLREAAAIIREQLAEVTQKIGVCEIANWVHQNESVSIQRDSHRLVTGTFGKARFRIFMDGGEWFAGVIGVGGNWRESIGCHTLEEFKSALAQLGVEGGEDA